MPQVRCPCLRSCGGCSAGPPSQVAGGISPRVNRTSVASAPDALVPGLEAWSCRHPWREVVAHVAPKLGVDQLMQFDPRPSIQILALVCAVGAGGIAEAWRPGTVRAYLERCGGIRPVPRRHDGASSSTLWRWTRASPRAASSSRSTGLTTRYEPSVGPPSRRTSSTGDSSS